MKLHQLHHIYGIARQGLSGTFSGVNHLWDTWWSGAQSGWLRLGRLYIKFCHGFL